MFYAKNEENKKNFEIKQSWHQEEKKPPSQQRPPSNHHHKAVLKEAGSKALVNDYPQITHDILDQHLANNLLKDLGVHHPPQETQIDHYLNAHKFRGQSPKQKQSPSRGENNNDIVTTMATRLTRMESLCNAQKMELKEKNLTITQQRDQIVTLKATQSSKGATDAVEALQGENKALLLKVGEMETFLNQYGIKWVGHNKEPATDKKMKELAANLGQPKQKFNHHLPSEISIDVILRRVDELNYIMEKEGATEIYKNPQGMHQIKKMEAIPLGFYKNGIALKGFKFFSYGSNDSYQILADIMDGFFPYQLKLQYPNGTLLKVIDKTEQVFSADDLMQQKQVDLQSYDAHQFKPQSKEEFLDKLPKHVIKGGKIIPVRSEVAKLFTPTLKQQGNCRVDPEDGSIIVLTQAQVALDAGAPYDQDGMCTLKFRSETGQSTIIAVMWCRQSVQEMYAAVEEFRESKTKALEIILNFPRTVFDAHSTQNLEEAGLHPNAHLFFK